MSSLLGMGAMNGGTAFTDIALNMKIVNGGRLTIPNNGYTIAANYVTHEGYGIASIKKLSEWDKNNYVAGYVAIQIYVDGILIPDLDHYVDYSRGYAISGTASTAVEQYGSVQVIGGSGAAISFPYLLVPFRESFKFGTPSFSNSNAWGKSYATYIIYESDE